ncbi:MAG: hypothetical protein KGJ13_07035 [Patescibacteria group bacterium]|nr:hypothetical protein [Patescibacteria group bacterium]
MKLNPETVFGRVKTEIFDRATGRRISKSPWQKNLVFDIGLNDLADNRGFAPFFVACKIGSGNSANSYASGAITFTQSGTTITASGSFFTAAMTGGLFKWGTGTGGAEVYITYVNATTATASASATVTTPTVATVWQVQKTALDTFLYASNTYGGTAGDNSTSYSGNSVTMQRKFIFAAQASTYSVNEVGYFNSTGTGGTVNGRVVLSSTDTVTPSQYYVVTWQMTFTVSPGVPTAVADVGTNINTAGNAMQTVWDCQIVASNGVNANSFAGAWYSGGVMDGHSFNGSGQNVYLGLGAAPTLPASIQTTAPGTEASFILLGSASRAQSTSAGFSSMTVSFNITTTGQTVNYIGLGGSQISSGGNKAQSFVLVLTTPYVCPSGTFQGSITFTVQFQRNLSN